MHLQNDAPLKLAASAAPLSAFLQLPLRESRIFSSSLRLSSIASWCRLVADLIPLEFLAHFD